MYVIMSQLVDDVNYYSWHKIHIYSSLGILNRQQLISILFIIYYRIFFMNFSSIQE